MAAEEGIERPSNNNILWIGESVFCRCTHHGPVSVLGYLLSDTPRYGCKKCGGCKGLYHTVADADPGYDRVNCRRSSRHLDVGENCQRKLDNKMADELDSSAKRQIAQNITSTTQQSNGVAMSNHYKEESKS